MGGAAAYGGQGAAMTGGGMTGGAPTGGYGGTPTGATGGVAGTGGTGNVGATGGVTGGTGGGPIGGTGGAGATGGVTGGAGGVTGGAGGVTGGTGGGPIGGTGGAGATGGVTGGTGGDGATGGVTGGTGGAGATGGVDGGTGGDGATGGTGGSQPVRPELVTSAQGAYWQEGTLAAATGNADITVNEGQTFQTWDGWGGTFNEAGWEVLLLLSDAERARAIELLFGPDGCNFTYGRIPIGASDYGLDRYTLCDSPWCDATMAGFSIDRDQNHLIPYIHAALAVKPDIRFWASPWTPPPWMKDNNAYDRGNMKGDATTLEAHAHYLALFVQAYAGENINIEAIHPQNEPGYPQDYPSCSWSSQVYVDFVGNYLGPRFAQDIPNTEIWLGTMSNPNSNAIVQAVMSNGTASQYISGISLQWGMDDNAQQIINSYHLPVMQSEHQCGNYPWEGADQNHAPNDHAYGVESWQLIKKWLGYGVNSYLAWNMVLDTNGVNLDTQRRWAQNALLVVDRNSRTLIETPAFYVFRHFAQFIDPGAQRIGVSGGDALAFRNPDGSIATVIYNSGAARQMTVGVGGTVLQFQAPGNGWATVFWDGA